MKPQGPAHRPRSRRKQALFWAVYLGLLGLTPQSLAVIWRTSILYEDVKGARRGVSGKLYRADPELGYAPVPGSRGSWRVTPGFEVPVRFDERGFRVPIAAESAARRGRRPRVLALGCSYTVGAACRAEEAYPYLVAASLGGEAVNAAVGGYGLAQMVLRARRLIPKHRPDYVLAQYADWLVRRSQVQIAPSLLGKVPTPYFFEADDGRVRVQPPVFSTRLFALPVWRYANERRGAWEFLSFFWEVGVPLFVHEDVTFSIKRSRELMGVIPKPSLAGDEIVRAAYGELAALSKANGARLVLVIVELGTGAARRAWLEGLEDVDRVDAETALWNELASDGSGSEEPTTAAYLKAYGHWYGSPPVLVDWHPNPRAHAVVAREVIRVIGSGWASRAAKAGS